MKKVLISTGLILSLSACGDSNPTLTNREKYICTQCHAFPLADQHAAAEWPGVVARMIGHMQANNRSMPDVKEQEEIIKFFQTRSGR